jgi:hypothetical protein
MLRDISKDSAQGNMRKISRQQRLRGMTSKAANIHASRVYLAQSRHFTTRHRGFSFVLLAWAANARRRAMATKPALPAQGDLFGGNE